MIQLKKLLILILAAVLCMRLCACRRVIGVDTTGLQHFTMTYLDSPETRTEFTAQLTADGHYKLPDMLEITVNGKPLVEGYTYDPVIGTLTIEKKYVKGDIAVTGTATEQVYGTWVCTVDMLTDVVERKSLLDPALLAHLELTEFTFPVVLTLLPDGTYTFGVDPAGYAAAVDSLHSQLAAATDIMLEGMLEQDKIDMGVSEFLNYTNLTYDKLLEQSYALLLPVDIAAAMEQSGSFTWTGDSLQLGEKVANAATLQEGTLTLTAAEGETLPYAQYLFPMTLTRAD